MEVWTRSVEWKCGPGVWRVGVDQECGEWVGVWSGV